MREHTNIFHRLLKYKMSKAQIVGITQILVLFIAVSCISIVTCCTIVLYSHYGPLTPNGNRYYHSFNLDTVLWNLVILAFVAMFSLTYPSIRYGLSNCVELRGGGVFPSRSTISKLIAQFLSTICVGSQVFFTTYFYFTVHEYLSNHSRVMAEDLETIFLSLAYLGCILFWGMVNTIYSVIFRFKW